MSEHGPKYVCTCHGNTCFFCFVFRAALFLLCQVFLLEVLCLIPWQETWQFLFGGCHHLADFSPFRLIYNPFLLADGHHSYSLSFHLKSKVMGSGGGHLA